MVYVLVHDGDGDYVIGGVVGAENDEVHGLDANAIVALEHHAVEVLLDAIVIVGGVGKVQAVEGGLTAKGGDKGLALRCADFAAAFPVVDGEEAVVITTDEVDGSGDVQCCIVNRPLLAVGTDVIVVDELEELLVLTLKVDVLSMTGMGEVAGGKETAVLKVIFGLFVEEGSYGSSHAAYTLPLGKRLGNGYAITILLQLSSTLGIEGFEEKGYERADGQELVLPFVQIDVTFGQEIDVFVLRIASCVGETTHLLRHGFCSAIHGEASLMGLNIKYKI